MTPVRFFHLRSGARGGFYQPVLSPFRSRALESNSVPGREPCFLSITGPSNLFKICPADCGGSGGEVCFQEGGGRMCAEWVFSETLIVERVGNTIVYFAGSYLSLAPHQHTKETVQMNRG